MTSTRDLILLLHLIRAAGRVEGRKRLQKMVCVAKTRDNIPFTFRFIPYFYGPYSDELAEAVASLRGADLIAEDKIWLSDDIVQYEYYLTDKGKQVLSHAGKDLRKTVNRLSQRIENMNTLQTSELVLLAKSLPFS